jgi:hypothetical protein
VNSFEDLLSLTVAQALQFQTIFNHQWGNGGRRFGTDDGLIKASRQQPWNATNMINMAMGQQQSV